MRLRTALFGLACGVVGAWLCWQCERGTWRVEPPAALAGTGHTKWKSGRNGERDTLALNLGDTIDMGFCQVDTFLVIIRDTGGPWSICPPRPQR